MLPPGFEPGSQARKARMLDRTTLQEHIDILCISFLFKCFEKGVGLTGFEPATSGVPSTPLNKFNNRHIRPVL